MHHGVHNNVTTKSQHGTTLARCEALQKNHYPHASIADVTEAFKAQKMFSSRE
jgi:hypothetical protein